MNIKKNYILELEELGEPGSRTKLDTSVHPPLVLRLHIIFNYWSGDEIVSCYPALLVTEKLGASLTSSGVTGFELGEVKIGISPDFEVLSPKLKLPPFKWLKILGDAKSDMCMTSDFDLAVSQKAFDVIMATKPTILEYKEV